MEAIKKIELFGDSILKGIQINPRNMRYHVDNHIDIEMISKEHSFVIRNHSQLGSTITKGYTLLKRYLQNGLKCDAVVMDFGGNDCDFKWKEIAECPDDVHMPNTPLNVFVDIYHQMITALKEHSILPVLTTLPPLEPQKFFNWFCKGLNKENIMKWLKSINRIYVHQEDYSKAVEKIAHDEKVPLVDLRSAFLKNDRVDVLLCEDGTHPNTAGQKIITEAFSSFARSYYNKLRGR